MALLMNGGNTMLSSENRTSGVDRALHAQLSVVMHRDSASLQAGLSHLVVKTNIDVPALHKPFMAICCHLASRLLADALPSSDGGPLTWPSDHARTSASHRTSIHEGVAERYFACILFASGNCSGLCSRAPGRIQRSCP